MKIGLTAEIETLKPLGPPPRERGRCGKARTLIRPPITIDLSYIDMGARSYAPFVLPSRWPVLVVRSWARMVEVDRFSPWKEGAFWLDITVSTRLEEGPEPPMPNVTEIPLRRRWEREIEMLIPAPMAFGLPETLLPYSIIVTNLVALIQQSAGGSPTGGSTGHPLTRGTQLR